MKRLFLLIALFISGAVGFSENKEAVDLLIDRKIITSCNEEKTVCENKELGIHYYSKNNDIRVSFMLPQYPLDIEKAIGNLCISLLETKEKLNYVQKQEALQQLLDTKRNEYGTAKYYNNHSMTYFVIPLFQDQTDMHIVGCEIRHKISF